MGDPHSGTARSRQFRYLFHLGCLSRMQLFHRWHRSARRTAAALAVLFTGDLGSTRHQFWPCVAGTAPRMVAVVHALLASPTDSALPGRIPLHVLLLPGRLLQGVLGRSRQLRSRRAGVPRWQLSRRAKVPAHHAEHSPLLLVCRGVVHRPACLGRHRQLAALQR